MLVFVVSSLFTIILLLIIVVASHATSSMSTPSIISSANSTSAISMMSTPSANLIDQKNKNNSSLEFEITDKIKDLIKDHVDGNKTNAAVVIGFVDAHGTQFYGYGKPHNMSNAVANENTIFSIGSNTKVFTTTLLADMVNKGFVKLDYPIEKYLPSNISIPQYNGHKITIEDLATHTSGLPEFPDNYCSSFDPAKTEVRDSVQYRTEVFDCAKDYDFGQFYQALSSTTLTREPGSKAEYSTFGIGLLGHILALKSNMSSFDELLKQNILNVLGMDDTGFVLSDSQKSRLAIGHFNSQELPSLNMSNPIAPGGGLYSTVNDMLKFLSANMGLIKTELDDSMQKSHLIRQSTGQIVPNNIEAPGLGLYIGLGWFITTNLGHEVIWHNGATIGGYNAYMAFNPTTERGIVILCSTDVSDFNITTISFSQNDELSYLIWRLLNQ